MVMKTAHEWWKSLRMMCTDIAEEAQILSLPEELVALAISKAGEGLLSLKMLRTRA